MAVGKEALQGCVGTPETARLLGVTQQIEFQNAQYSRRLQDVENGQREIAAGLNDVVDIPRDSADNERRFQRDMLDLFTRFTQQVTYVTRSPRSPESMLRPFRDSLSDTRRNASTPARLRARAKCMPSIVVPVVFFSGLRSIILAKAHRWQQQS